MAMRPKIKIEKECRNKWNKSRNYDKGMGSYTCYYRGWSVDVWGVYSPKAAIRRIRKMIKKGEL